MYPRIPWELIADRFESRGTFCEPFFTKRKPAAVFHPSFLVSKKTHCIFTEQSSLLAKLMRAADVCSGN